MRSVIISSDWVDVITEYDSECEVPSTVSAHVKSTFKQYWQSLSIIVLIPSPNVDRRALILAAKDVFWATVQIRGEKG